METLHNIYYKLQTEVLHMNRTFKMTNRIAICLFRNDLRFHDNEVSMFTSLAIFFHKCVTISINLALDQYSVTLRNFLKFLQFGIL